MSSTRCPNCRQENFSNAIVCRHCEYPLMGGVPRAAQPLAPKRVSKRWLVNAVLVSIAYAVLLVCIIFLIYVIPSAQSSGETGWRDFTATQWRTMSKWYFLILDLGVFIIFAIFYRRRHNND